MPIRAGRLSETRDRAIVRLRAILRGVPPVAEPAPAIPDAAGDPAAGEWAPPGGGSIRRARIRLDARACAAILLVAALGVALGAVVWLRARPHEVDLGPAAVVAAGTPPASPGPAPGSAPAATAESSAASTGAAGTGVAAGAAAILVDVQGEVRRPGVVALPAGARVRDALHAAGGARRGVATASLNLARPLADGEQIVLDPDGAMAANVTSGGPAAGSAPAAGPLDLNAAGLAELDGLPGVGPILAQRILDWRAEHGRFTAIEELQEVPGIGPATFADLRSKVRV